VKRRTPLRTTLLAIGAASLLAGCSGSEFSSGEQGYVEGNGTITFVDPAERGEPRGEVAGETVYGDQVSLGDQRGSVVVIPVWGSWCAPCRSEAPMLAEAARDLEDDGVVFLGINSRDENTAKVKAFEERFDIPYESIYDPAGETLLAFHGVLPPQTIPSFVFVDEDGKVAARVLGEIDRSTLYGVLEDVLGTELSDAGLT
jgi:thiol-disulfide isomerase/thioredoxin